ncbi:MAG: CocE/NonD family hydrolase [Acidimicrobiia bacterium]|nr:CocE/NonD family hydrolase [Acidimicrobiia bacterium]
MASAPLIPGGSAGATPGTATPEPEGPRVLAGIEQVYVTGLPAGDVVTISRAAPTSPRRGQQAGTTTPVATATVDRLGSAVFRNLSQGARYVVHDQTSDWTARAQVLVAGDNPPASFYRGTVMRAGLNYIRMRDGITLAATVRPPLGRRLDDGPFPTVIEYSGYQVAAPADAVTNIIGMALGLPNDPLAPTGETYVGSVLLRLAGYAVVSVQLRGSGCSGGEADLFDLPSAYDGYDAVETVAAQDFVRGGRVGMVGISFSAFSQIVTAGTRPPHLAAIAPLSFLSRLWDVGRPGGIVNNGFAEGWLRERQANAEPAPSPGAQPYANALVATDATCRANQALRLQTRDAITAVRTQPTMTADYTRRDFTRWMAAIRVPVFGSLQFQDEQTSAYTMLDTETLLGANDRVWLNLTSGRHGEAIDVGTFIDLLAFLDIYVAGRAPEVKWLVYITSSFIWGSSHGRLPLPPSLFATYEEARRSFESRPRVTVGLERPLAAEPGARRSRWGLTSSTWPPAGAVPSTMFLGSDGTLSSTPGEPDTAAFVADPSARPRTYGPTWSTVPADKGLGFVTAPLSEDVVAAGPAAADLWLASTSTDTDVQVTVTEVRPDGSEMFVNAGVQRASVRHTEDAASTPTVPAFTFDRVEPLAAGFNEVHVQILPFAHAFRAGSRIRIVVAPVGGDHSAWAFDSVDTATPPTNTVGLGGPHASSVSLTLLPGVTPRAPLPPCKLAGQPCRPYVPAANGG